MTNVAKPRLESSKSNGLKGVMDYLVYFSENKGIFEYPRIETMELTSHSRILVLAPHPDDDVIGCGGTIRKAVLKGGHVKVIYLTDGRFGNNSYSEKELIALRKVEAMDGLRVLGCSDALFLGNPDMGLRVSRSNVSRLEGLLEDYRPTAMFVPSFLEVPPDHLNTARLAAHALRHYENDLNCYGYEVWCAIMPSVLVDITDVIDTKVNAISQHRSQIAVTNYANKIKGLNAYRSMYASRGVDFCEAFTSHDRKAYIDMAERLGFFDEEPSEN